MRVLGIDPAASCGWAVIENLEYVDGGTKKFKHPTAKQISDGKKGTYQKWIDFRNWLEVLLPKYEPDYVIFELVKNRTSTLAVQSYGFMKYTVGSVSNEYGCEAYPIDVKRWQKVACGQGNLGKEGVAAFLKDKYNIEFESDDHSDATGIALAGYILADNRELETLWHAFKGKGNKK